MITECHYVDMFFFAVLECAVPENIHPPPTGGIGIFLGGWGFCKAKKLKKCMKLNCNFQRGVGRYGYFLELHN